MQITNTQRFRFRAVFGIAIWCGATFLYAHVPLAVSGGSFFGSGAGRSYSSSSIFATNDSLRLSLDFYMCLSNTWAMLYGDSATPAFHSAGLRGGDPLGTGGKISNIYNSFLYLTSPSERATPFRGDMRVQQSDFGYVPLWQPNGMSARLRYRFLPSLLGSIAFNFDINSSRASSADVSNALKVGELLLKWNPLNSGLVSVNFGSVPVSGTYVAIFDQMPLENFRINGLLMNYSRLFSDKTMVSADIGAGMDVLGRTVEIDDSLGNQYNTFAVLNHTRVRNQILGRFRYNAPKNFSCALLGGYQMIPGGDSSQTTTVDLSKTLVEKRGYPDQSGWHCGAEVMYGSILTNHAVIFGYGNGVVQTGWGSPDYVNAPPSDTVSQFDLSRTLKPFFSMQGSDLMYAVYWGDLRQRWGTVSGGVWGVWSRPSKHPVTYALNTSHYRYDSLSHIVDWIESGDTVTLQAQDFRTVKCALSVTGKIGPMISPGIRYDGIFYLDPKAHSNIFEMNEGKAKISEIGMDPIFIPEQSALWEKEAVNVNIISPFLKIDVARTLTFQTTCAFAFYGAPVFRNGFLSDRHSNFTLSGVLMYRFAVLQ